MSRVFIVGGSGKVATHLIPMLIENGHEAKALHRKAEQAGALKDLGADPVIGDLTGLSVAEMAERMTGADVVVFSAGAAGAGKAVTDAVDGRGLELSVDAARQAGVDRFLLVSAFPDAGRTKNLGEGFENYIHVKRLADAYLVASGLDYVLLRPGTLSDSDGTGKVRIDRALPYGNVPRVDVAATLLGLIERPHIRRDVLELTEGEDAVEAALERIAPGQGG